MSRDRSVPASVWILLGLGLMSLGASSVLIRLAGDVPALAIAAWRTVFVALLVGPLALVKNRREFRLLTGRDLGLIAVAGFLLGLHFIAWIGSVQLTSIAKASVLVSTSPMFIVVLSLVFLRVNPTVRVLAAVVIAIGGSAIIGLSTSSTADGVPFPRETLGNTLALTASLLVAIYFLIGRSVRPRVSFLTYFAPLAAVAAVTALVACLALGVDLWLPLPVVGLCLLMALGPGLLGHGSFNFALRYVGATTLGLLTLSEPVLASVGGLLIFKERPSALAIFGMVLVLVAIASVVVRRKTPQASPAPQTPS